MAKKKAPKQETVEFTAKLVLKALGKTYEATGATLLAAIDSLKPVNARGVSILTVSKGSKSKERILQANITQRLFNSHGHTREIFLKNAVLLFQGFDQ